MALRQASILQSTETHYLSMLYSLSCPRADLGNNAQYSTLDYSTEESQNPTTLVPRIRKRDNHNI